MRGFLREAHPHLVLLGTLDAHERKIGDGKEQDEHSQLDVREIGQTAQQRRVLVVEVLRGALINLDINLVLAVLEVAQFLVEVFEVSGRNFKRQTILGLRQAEVAVQQDVILIIDQQHGDVVVGLDDAQQEVNVGGTGAIITAFAAHRRQFLGCIGPNLHALAFLHGKVLHQVVGDVKEQCHQHQRDGQEHHLPDATRVIYVAQICHAMQK